MAVGTAAQRPEGATSGSLFSLKGKTALITGASSGIGAHWAVMLAREGANVVAAARRQDKLAATVAQIADLREAYPDAGSAVALNLDVAAGKSAVDAAVEKAWNAFGRIDILVNNAGVFRGGDTVSFTEEDLDLLFNTNVKGLYHTTQAVVARQLADKKGGSIINVSSIAGLDGGAFQGSGPYSATKAAVSQLTRNLALELSPSNIRVNSISPGLFPTEMSQGLADSESAKRWLNEDVPLRRAGDTAHDLDGPLILLASDAGAYITGTNITVDGGATKALKSFF